MKQFINRWEKRVGSPRKNGISQQQENLSNQKLVNEIKTAHSNKPMTLS